MTTTEFSNEFDVLYNNITSNQAPGLDEYEKSVFLTKAQDEIVKAYFDPKGNKFQEGYDGSERRQIDFSMLMRTINGTPVTPTIDLHTGSNNKFYAIPQDILLYINEILTVTRDGSSTHLTVIPLNYIEYNRLMSKPFKRPLKNQAWRLISSGAASSYTYTDYSAIASYLAADQAVVANATTIFATIDGKPLAFDSTKLKVGAQYFTANGTLSDTAADGVVLDAGTISSVTAKISATVAASSTVAELIPGPNDTVSGYIIRYVARPRPIILTDLTSSGLSLGDNEQAEQTCQLDPIIHREVLQRAVELAKAAYAGNLESQIILGQASETNMGIVTSNNK